MIVVNVIGLVLFTYFLIDLERAFAPLRPFIPTSWWITHGLAQIVHVAFIVWNAVEIYRWWTGN